MELLTLDQINAAAELLKPVVRPTPVVASRILSDCMSRQVWLKCENLQRTGGHRGRNCPQSIHDVLCARRDPMTRLPEAI